MNRLIVLPLILCCLIGPEASARNRPSSEGVEYDLLLRLPDELTLAQKFQITKTVNRMGVVNRSVVDIGYDAHVKRNETGYIIERVVKDFSIPDDKDNIMSRFEKGSPQWEAIKNAVTLDNTNVRYQCDDDLYPVRIENWGDLRTLLVKATVDTISYPGNNKDISKLTDQYKSIYDRFTPETASGLILQSESFMSIPHNKRYRLNKSIVRTVEVAVPLFDVPVKETVSIDLYDRDLVAGLVRIRYRSAPSTEDLRTFLGLAIPAFLTKMKIPEGAAASIREKAAGKDPSDLMTLATDCDFKVSINTGLVKSGHCEKVSRVALGGETRDQTELYEFSQEAVR